MCCSMEDWGETGKLWTKFRFFDGPAGNELKNVSLRVTAVLVVVKGHVRISSPLEKPGKPPALIVVWWAQVGARRGPSPLLCDWRRRRDVYWWGAERAGQQQRGSVCECRNHHRTLIHSFDTGQIHSLCSSWTSLSPLRLAGWWGVRRRSRDNRVGKNRCRGRPRSQALGAGWRHTRFPSYLVRPLFSSGRSCSDKSLWQM